MKGFNVSWIAVPLSLVIGVAIVSIPVPDSILGARLNGFGWGILLVLPLCVFAALLRIPVSIRRGQLRRTMPHAIVESSSRTGALSKDLALLNEADGGTRDSTWGALCVVFDEFGISAWRWNDRDRPEWALPWSRLTQPVTGTVTSKYLWSTSSQRGLTTAVSVDDRRIDLHLTLFGAGVFGIFALSRRRLEEIAANCASWRDAAIARHPSP